MHMLDYPASLVAGLERAIRSHELLLLEKSVSSQCRKTGVLKTHWQKLVAFAKVTQRLVGIVRGRGSDMQLTPALPCAPCQLGFSDAEDWKVVGCRCQEQVSDINDLLQHSCRCGIIPLKYNKDPHGYLLPEKELKNVLVHNLKEEMMQMFLAGSSVDKVLTGQCHSVGDDAPDGMWCGFAMVDADAVPAGTESLSNHMCLLLDEEQVRDIVVRYEQDIPGTLTQENLRAHVPLSLFVAVGTFQLVTSVHRPGDKIMELRLSAGTKTRGRCLLMVGPYVGNIVYALEAVLQTRAKESTFALRDMFRHQLVDESQPMQGTRYLPPVTVASVEAVAGRRGAKLHEDQKQCITDLAAKPYWEACAGMGKSFLASLIMSVVSEASAGMRKKLFFLTPNRDQRQGAVRDLRQGMVDPLKVMGFGRPADADMSKSDQNCFDAETEKQLEDLTEDQRHKIQSLEADAERVMGSNCSQEEQRRALEALAAARFELTKQREALVLNAFERAEIICMTLDGFLQLITKKSALSHLMADYEVGLAIIDECQLFPAERIAAVACNASEIVCCFDRQQAMPIVAEVQNASASASADGCLLFSSDANVYDWQHAAGREDNQIVRVWELLPVGATQGPLNVSRRFGPKMCSHFRRTTDGYYVAPGEAYMRGRGIYSVCEVPGYDGSGGNRIPNSSIQATIYSKNLYHGVDSHGCLRPEAVLIPKRVAQARSTEDRVGLCLDILLNVLHEGLTFAAALQFNAASGENAPILTLIYHNKARLHFQCLINYALGDRETCRRYGIAVPASPEDLWQVRTPNTVASRTVALVQLVVITPNMSGQHVLGHLKSEKRKTVAITRARRVLAYHLAEECMETTTRESPWFALYSDLKERCFDGITHRVVGDISTPISGDYVFPAHVSQTLTAFRELRALFSDVVTLSRQLSRTGQATTQSQRVTISLMEGIMQGLFGATAEAEAEDTTASASIFERDMCAMLREDLFRKHELTRVQDMATRVLRRAPCVLADHRATVQVSVLCDRFGSVTPEDMEVLARFLIALVIDIAELRSNGTGDEVVRMR